MVFTFHRQEFLPTKQLPTKHRYLREYATDKKSYLQKSLPTKSFDLRKNYLQKNYLQGSIPTSLSRILNFGDYEHTLMFLPRPCLTTKHLSLKS